MIAPLMYDDCGEISQEINSPTSRTVPSRPSGI